MASPLPTEELQKVIITACETAIGSAEKYDHSLSSKWNNTIINTILETLIEKTSVGEGDSKAPAYKYITTSTIIQHPESKEAAGAAGRRGMHSAIGSFWNNEKDGTYNYKWDAADKIGIEIVVTISWIAI